VAHGYGCESEAVLAHMAEEGQAGIDILLFQEECGFTQHS
jgi:hypothetical protein